MCTVRFCLSSVYARVDYRLLEHWWNDFSRMITYKSSIKLKNLMWVNISQIFNIIIEYCTYIWLNNKTQRTKMYRLLVNKSDKVQGADSAWESLLYKRMYANSSISDVRSIELFFKNGDLFIALKPRYVNEICWIFGGSYCSFCNMQLRILCSSLARIWLMTSIFVKEKLVHHWDISN